MDGTATFAFFAHDIPRMRHIADIVSEACITEGASAEETSTKINDINASEADDIDATINIDGKQVRLKIYAAPTGTIPNPFLTLSMDENVLSCKSYSSGDGYGGFPATIVDLIVELATALDPLMVSSFSTAHVTAGPPPKAVTPAETPVDLDRIPWLGIYSEEVLQHFGGRSHVMETPAWRIEELANGSILIITTREPWDDYETPLPADQHLLDGNDDLGGTEIE